MKKKFLILILLLTILTLFIPLGLVQVEAKNIKEEFNEQVNSQLTDFNFSELDKILQNFGVNSQSIFGEETFTDKLTSIISGEYITDSTSIVQSIINIIFEEILNIVPLLCSIITIVILCSFISQIRSSVNGKSINDIVHFVCYAIVIIIISKVVVDCLNLAEQTIVNMQSQMQVIFPILLTAKRYE